MVFYVFRRICFIIVLAMSLFVGGCAWVAAGAVAVGVAGVAMVGGSVSEIDKTEMALAVEKAIYAIEKVGGTVTDSSFADGYAKGTVGEYRVSVNIYPENGGAMNVSVRASKFLMPNTEVAEKILSNYRKFKR